MLLYIIIYKYNTIYQIILFKSNYNLELRLWNIYLILHLKVLLHLSKMMSKTEFKDESELLLHFGVDSTKHSDIICINKILLTSDL